MKSCSCPSCGANIDFQSSLSVYAVCKYCQSMVVRHDLDVELIGKMASLPEDMSPLQIGTSGIYNGIRFGIIGRIRLSWTDGFWNEWFIIFDDGRKGWLAEAQGFYAVNFEIDQDKLPDLKEFNKESSKSFLGKQLVISKKILKIVDIKEAVCVGSEGELPFTASQGRKITSIDLVGTNSEFASIEIEGDQRHVYIGNYVEWEELHCHNFRILEGW
jgi:hypothetical protein